MIPATSQTCHRCASHPAVVEILGELSAARSQHGPMAWEFDELWDEIKRRHLDGAAMRRDIVQLAAMAIRFIEDVCDKEGR